MPCHALELAPFQGLRYISPDVDRFVDDEFDIARLLAPPYDIPGAQEARELQHSDPHNAARVTLPFELGRESHPRYRKAAQLLHSWIEEGSWPKMTPPPCTCTNKPPRTVPTSAG